MAKAPTAVSRFKPHPRVYQIVTERLGVPTPEVGFVSSNYWDVCGAASFGFQAFWINRSHAVPDALGQQPRAVLDVHDHQP